MRRRLFLSIVALLGFILFGYIGFMITEDLQNEPFTAFYLTVMTVTTVGYGDIVPLSQNGQIIAMIVGLGGIGAVISTLQSVFDLAVSRNLRMELGIPERRVKMKDHYIICGYGNVGREVADRLKLRKEKYVVIEHDQEKIASLVESGLTVIRGDSEDEEVLMNAGIMNAKGLIAAMKDPQNLVTVLTAKTLNPKLYIVSEVEDDKNDSKLRRVGADVTVNCYRMGARIMVGRVHHAQVDPVCGAEIKDGLGEIVHEGRTYHFCSKECEAAFKAHPDRFMEIQRAIDETCGGAPANE